MLENERQAPQGSVLSEYQFEKLRTDRMWELEDEKKRHEQMIREIRRPRNPMEAAYEAASLLATLFFLVFILPYLIWCYYIYNALYIPAYDWLVSKTGAVQGFLVNVFGMERGNAQLVTILGEAVFYFSFLALCAIGLGLEIKFIVVPFLKLMKRLISNVFHSVTNIFK